MLGQASQPENVALRIAGDAGVRDVQVRVAERSVTLAEVCEAVGLQSELVRVDGARSVDPHVTPALDVLRSGTLLGAGTATTSASGPLSASGLVAPALVEVAQVAGIDCGSIAELPQGRYHLGSSNPIASAQGWYLRIDDGAHAASDRLPWHERADSTEAIAVRGAAIALSKPIDSERGHAGHVHRPPRHLPPNEIEPIELRPAPAHPKPAQPLSWATFLTPIPVGIVMALFFSPIFAVFSAMGPVIAVGRWIEGRRRCKRETQERAANVASMNTDLQQRVREQLETAVRQRWLASPHVPELWRRARCNSVRLWERRPGQPGYLQLTVGIGPDVITPVITGAKPDPEVHAAATAQPSRSVPHLIDLRGNQGIGIWGDREESLAVARSLVMQLVTLHGPADLSVGLLTSTASAPEWDFLKWLPQCTPSLVTHQASMLADAICGMSVGPVEIASQVPRVPAAFGGSTVDVTRVVVVLVDELSADVAALFRAATSAGIELRVVAIAANPTRLPASCSSMIEVGGSVVTVTSPAVASPSTKSRAAGISSATAGAWARSLAPMIDAEARSLDNATGGEIGLSALLGRLNDEEVRMRWKRAATAGRASAVIGVGDAGPISLDLGIDGPHALVAGTTGSGKSEFLRTWVMSLAMSCSPQQVNFVLIDFKGGGAFDVCARLPHVAGLITDLDEHLVGRAITSLRAELQRRELLFRELHVSTFNEALAVATEPLARLVIVIDEFAALATDYSELMSAIIDLAARGRSLGMHLVLATQRPSGVVDQKIRANTNLRVALRMQDAFDSRDVIGVPDAMSIDRHSPGRAIVSIGGDRPVHVKTAYSGALDMQQVRCVVRPFDLSRRGDTHPESTATLQELGSEVEPVTEIEVLLGVIECAALALDYRPRPLWADPLPTCLDWIDLGTRVLAVDDIDMSHSYALGLVDIPEQQSQVPWQWSTKNGALAIFGASAPCIGRVLTSIGCAVASAMSAERAHLYLIDGDAGRIGALSGLPHVGGYVTLAEPDRIKRTVELFEKALADRRHVVASDAADMFLIVDNIAAVIAVFDDLSAASLIDRLAALARDGGPLGLHLVLAARTVRDLPHRLAQQVPQRLVLNLSDPAGYLALGIKSCNIIDLPDMRAIDLATGRSVQLVEPPECHDAIDEAEPSPGLGPVPVGAFPTSVLVHDLPAASRLDGALLLPIGISESDLAPAMLVLQPGAHALVVSPPGGGRSAVLSAIAQQVGRSGLAIKVLRIGVSGSGLLTADVPGDMVTSAAELAEQIASKEIGLVLVDDAEYLDAELTAALSVMSARGDRSIRVVVATTPSFARSIQAWIGPLRASATGVIVGGTHFDGDALSVTLSKMAGLGRVAGRGHVIVRGRVQPAQLASLSTGAR